MVKNILFLVLLLIPVCLCAQMSDSQVIDYIKSEHTKGTSEQVIGATLLQKGATQAQLERIKSQVEQANQANTTNIGGTTTQSVIRASQADEVVVRNVEGDAFTDMLRRDIFGKNIFNRKNVTFAPDVNIPTPVDYKLGPGDEVVIEIWGASQASIRKVISPEGTISIESLGPISLSGMTINEANNFLKGKLSSLYSGVDDSYGPSQIKLTLGQIRTIQINIIGEVAVPGTYSISSLSNIYHALYLAGGINDIGSLREINLFRKNKKITSVDVYDFLLYGQTDDTRLYDGDVINIPPYKSLVNITGQVKRPMYYEMVEGETVQDLINYAGGFVGGAYTDKITLSRKTGGYDKIFTLNANETSGFNLTDGDVITIGGGLNLYENRVQIEGKIFRPGYFEIGKDIITVKDLIERAGGLKEDAFLDRAILTRQKDDLTFETLTLNLNDIKSQNIVLQKNDVLSIAANKVETDLGNFAIYGMVANPGSYRFAENTTIKDLILKAGGLLSSASTAKVDVSRRIIDPNSTTNATIIAETFSFPLENGLIADGKEEFVLEPYDQVYIRKSPGYQTQRNVSIEGEVLFPGGYTLKEKEQRISDLVKEAGGLSNSAYIEGAKLIRRQSRDELARQRESIALAKRGGLEDTISTKLMDTDVLYPIGIELNKALEKPMSEYDLVLKPGDNLIIPEFDNTIKINGAVMYPNTVLFEEGKKVKHYIEQAGGYSEVAEKKRAYIIYMNGTVAKAKGGSKDLVKPGCEIIIPVKEQKERMSTGEIISLSSAAVSMASVVALLINALTK
ncbi:MAG: SLBB domain-containing protein [Prevotella sp.]|nr:SLBB domain-containing protein [Prevotella sp.]